MSDNLYLIIAIVLFAIGLAAGISVLINRLTNKSNKSKAEVILDELFSSIEKDIKIYILNYMKDLDINAFELNDKAEQFKLIENTIVDYGFNKVSELIKKILNDDYPDKKGIYTIIMSLFTEDKINTFVFKILENDEIQESIANIYNQLFGEDIDKIEEEDKLLAEELEEYEKESVKDETIEQHNQSIEEYAKMHIQDKINELNESYDEIEKVNPNVVPVRDLRDLTALIDDEEIIPPSDEEPDVIVDDGTIEVVEYLDNITDNNLEKTEE